MFGTIVNSMIVLLSLHFKFDDINDTAKLVLEMNSSHNCHNNEKCRNHLQKPNFIALDSNNLKDALKYSAQMLSEFRTSKLSPHIYYELYMCTFDQLRKLEMFFEEETHRGCSIIDVYELVQHAGSILPRLYLLCIIGFVYIKSKEAPAEDVLNDLVEMCRGIQNPASELFLISYLSQVSKDKLPDIGSEYYGTASRFIVVW